MRSRDAAQVKARCREAIPALLAAHGLPAPVSITQDEFGWVNPCFFVDDALVVRFNARDPHLPKFQREVAAFELLARHDIPVPEVLAFDDAHGHVPWDVLVTRRLPGKNLESVWPSLDAEAREHAAFDAGALLARMHAVPVDGFGEIATSSKDTSWLTAVTGLRNGHIAECRRTGVLGEADFVQVVAAFEEAREILATVTVPSLVHRDYHLGNLLFDGERITGVVDFEWAIHGDPEMDLCLLAELATICPGSREPILAGYTGARPLSRHARRKVALYRCLRNLELCAVTIEHHDGEDLAECVAVTRKQIAGLNDLAGE